MRITSIEFRYLILFYRCTSVRPFGHSTAHNHNNYVLQGELVDSVEHHVESSTDYIKQGHLELKQAEVYQSKARKVPEKKQTNSNSLL